MPMPHPWRALRGMRDTYIHFRNDLPPGVRSITDGRRIIWMRDDLTSAERRCVLAHELAHLERDHTECQSEPVERLVDHHAARYLLPDIHDVADALAFAAGRLDEAADDLWVTEKYLRARLDPLHLHVAEKEILRRRMAALAEDLGA